MFVEFLRTGPVLVPVKVEQGVASHHRDCYQRGNGAERVRWGCAVAIVKKCEKCKTSNWLDRTACKSSRCHRADVATL